MKSADCIVLFRVDNLQNFYLSPESLLSAGRRGDPEEADESFLPDVPALPEQHQHGREGAGGITSTRPHQHHWGRRPPSVVLTPDAFVAGLHHPV